MAEYMMKDMAKKAGCSADFKIALAATSWEEIGNPVYSPVKRKLAEHGISCEGHSARQLTNSDYDKYDLLIGMYSGNLRDMYRICGGDYADKMHLLLDYTDHPRNVSDPWYTCYFDAAWRDVEVGCRLLLEAITDGVM
jgi:protein-tyrosine phosphatase